MKETKLFELVTGTEMKPWLSRNMLPNINTCKNGWLNFSASLRVVSLNLLKLTQFAWRHFSNYFNFLCAVPRDDVIENTRFLMRPPVNHSTMVPHIKLNLVVEMIRWFLIFGGCSDFAISSMEMTKSHVFLSMHIGYPYIVWNNFQKFQENRHSSFWDMLQSMCIIIIVVWRYHPRTN